MADNIWGWLVRYGDDEWAWHPASDTRLRKECEVPAGESVRDAQRYVEQVYGPQPAWSDISPKKGGIHGRHGGLGGPMALSNNAYSSGLVERVLEFVADWTLRIFGHSEPFVNGPRVGAEPAPPALRVVRRDPEGWVRTWAYVGPDRRRQRRELPAER